MLGSQPLDTDPVFNKALYCIFSLFICIVNLNLLIAIISETYATVFSTLEATDTQAKADILSEIGGFKKYFYG